MEKLGILVLDKIKLRASVDFNKSTYKFDGFVDFETTSRQDSSAVPADRALVTMFVPPLQKWVQPVASFETRGAAPGLVLAKLVLESVLQLQQPSASVIAVVSDGTGNNQSMWMHAGVSGKVNQPVNKVSCPSLEGGRFLYFRCDVPHIDQVCMKQPFDAHACRGEDGPPIKAKLQCSH